MKKKYLLLPIVGLMSLTSCGTANPPAPTAEGKLPEGGTEIVKKEEKTAKLASVMKDASTNLSQIDSFGLRTTLHKFEVGGISEDGKSRVDVHVAGGEPTFVLGADHLFNGTKENTKVGINIPAFDIFTEIDYKPVEGDSYLYRNTTSFGGAGAYLDNGNVYADLSQGHLPDLVVSLAKFTYPFLGELTTEWRMVEMIIKNIADYPDLVDTLIAQFLGSDFNYKIKVPDAVNKYPLVTYEEVKEEDSVKEAENLEAGFEEATGLKWDDVCSVFTYGKYTGFEFYFKLRDFKTDTYLPESTQDMGFVFGDDSGVAFSAIFDEKGLPLDFSFRGGVVITISDEEVSKHFGGDLTLGANLHFDGSFVYGSNPVSFPESYEGFNTLPFSL